MIKNFNLNKLLKIKKNKMINHKIPIKSKLKPNQKVPKLKINSIILVVIYKILINKFLYLHIKVLNK
jgi:hypothetical protein